MYAVCGLFYFDVFLASLEVFLCSIRDVYLTQNTKDGSLLFSCGQLHMIESKYNIFVYLVCNLKGLKVYVWA